VCVIKALGHIKMLIIQTN